MIRLALLAAVAAGCGASPPMVDPAWSSSSVARFVDPFIGTHGDGNTFPGATVPWGMTAASPHTRLPSPLDFLGSGKLAAAGYVDDDPAVHGFGLTHLSGVGCPDLGAPVVAAMTGTPAIDFDSYAATRADEQAWPGYYKVDLVEPNIRMEATATARGAAFRIFGRSDAPSVIFDVAHPLSWVGGGHANVVSPTEIEGDVATGEFCAKPNRQTVFFAARFDQPATSTGGTDGVGAWFTFPAGRAIELVVGVSYTSLDGARANLAAELAGKRFDELRLAAQNAWDATLDRVRVSGGTDEQRTIFYTALYHSLLHPSLASDVDGAHLRYGGNGAVDVDAAHERYHVFSLWDTYRTVHPLLGLVYPEQQRAMVRSLVEMTVEGGAPPGWELAGNEVQMMVGDPADIVLGDAAVKGFLPEASLVQAAWPMIESAALDTTSTKLHRPGNASYRSLGFVPIDEGDSV